MNRPAPREIKNRRAEKQLFIQWSETEQQTISHLRLRGLCPCSQCRAARIRGQISLVDESVTVEKINPFPYGVQLVFSDGHDRGIFPWSYLFEMELS
ncbi:DUF971 domain-containing protein [Saccharophagus sp. K07]|uniref:gamma-butyrobetaine hydroxylase-like domain-containing protein n=1 Tax=Saccharophagus sp. K07 TaxID=2283636 RepID=UPI0016520C07|nr:gamma-butyrobetaine hydroxylase-like domain-containing protein [Saccharophagus sp. K07]MBC6905119.1 DUF971 domain-containing protein [Saccharophagus sp. K07]